MREGAAEMAHDKWLSEAKRACASHGRRAERGQLDGSAGGDLENLDVAPGYGRGIGGRAHLVQSRIPPPQVILGLEQHDRHELAAVAARHDETFLCRDTF